MCFYLTISCGAERAAAVREFFSEGFRLRENKNPFFEKRFGARCAAFDVTDGHCSCSIFADLTAEEETNGETLRLIEKYRRKGWAENKIRRAIESHNSKPPRETDSGIREKLAQLYERIGSYRLFAHLYEGAIDEERLEAAGEKDLKTTELADKNRGVPADVIINIK